MKNRRILCTALFIAFIVIAFFLSPTEVGAAKKKSVKTAEAKVERVYLKFPEKIYRVINLIYYRKKYYVNIRGAAKILSERNLGFDVKIKGKNVNVSAFEFFSDKNYIEPYLDFYIPGSENKKAYAFQRFDVKVGERTETVRGLLLKGEDAKHIYFPLDFFKTFEKELGFSLRKKRDELLVGEKIYFKPYRLRLLSKDESEGVQGFLFGKENPQAYFSMSDLKRVVKGTSSDFGYTYDPVKKELFITYSEREKGKEKSPAPLFVEERKLEKIKIFSDYFGKLEKKDRLYVSTKAFVLKDEVFLDFGFFCKFMDWKPVRKENEFLLDDGKRQNFRVLKAAKGEDNLTLRRGEGTEKPYYDVLYEEKGDLVSVHAQFGTIKNRKEPSKPQVFSYENTADYLMEEGEAFVRVQRYRDDFSLLSEKKIAFEGEYFGGFFRGKLYNFILFGIGNIEMRYDAPTYRLIKYDKDFNRLASLEIADDFTTRPFDSGTVFMAEYGDNLVIHTSAWGMSTGFQRRRIFVVSAQTMTFMNGDDLVSEGKKCIPFSYGQRVQIDENGAVYFFDVGEVPPMRGLILTKAAIENGRLLFEGRNNPQEEFEGMEKRFTIMAFPKGPPGYGAPTRFTLGSVVQGRENFLIGGNHINYSAEKDFHVINATDGDTYRRDAYLFTVSKKNPALTNKIRLTNNAADGNHVSYSAPRIVKTGEDKFLVLWNKYLGDIKEEKVKVSLCYRYVNQDGTFLSEQKEKEGMEMTNTEPVFMNGKAFWTRIEKREDVQGRWEEIYSDGPHRYVRVKKDKMKEYDDVNYSTKILYILPVE